MRSSINSTNGNNNGIDFHKALEVLSLRSNKNEVSGVDADGSTASQGYRADSCPCSSSQCHYITKNNLQRNDEQKQMDSKLFCYSTENAASDVKKLGQIIDIHETTTNYEDLKESLEKHHQDIQLERKERQEVLQSQLVVMSVEELVATVLDGQGKRVEAYREFDEDLDRVLRTKSLTLYPSYCTKATASFSFVSETLITIQNILQDVRHSRPDLSDWIGKLQIREKEKLQMTAALHLEKIRLYQLQQQRSKLKCNDSNDAVQDDDVDCENKEDKILQLLQDEILSLRSRIDVCVRDINEILDEIRYAIVE